MDDLDKFHEEWIKDLYENNVLEDKSGTTFFNGF